MLYPCCESGNLLPWRKSGSFDIINFLLFYNSMTASKPVSRWEHDSSADTKILQVSLKYISATVKLRKSKRKKKEKKKKRRIEKKKK